MKFQTRCKVCNEPLINLGSRYAHPENECEANDGIKIVIIDEETNNSFNEVYGFPEKSTTALINELELEVGGLLKHNLELIQDVANFAELYETLLTVKINKVWESIKQWFMENIKGMLTKTKSTKK